MKRLTSLLAATALGASLLTGCGGDDGGDGGGSADDYCDVLKSAQTDFEELGSADFGNFDELADRVNELADTAPDEVKDDWEILANAFQGFVDALEDAGLQPEDLEGMQSGELPEGVDMEALSEAMTKAQELSGPEFEEATANIEQHAKDECNIDLSAG